MVCKKGPKQNAHVLAGEPDPSWGVAGLSTSRHVCAYVCVCVTSEYTSDSARGTE